MSENYNELVTLELMKIRKERELRKTVISRIAELKIDQYGSEFDKLNNLDGTDLKICACAGILGGLVDLLMIGIPHPGKTGIEGGFLDGLFREWFDKKFPEDAMERLSRQSASKVPFDAQDNRNTCIPVDGLSTYYHRMLSLGHDPVLGWIVGVYDILNGTMTTISKSGGLCSQQMECYAKRVSHQVLDAIQKEYRHLATDVNTSMGLPVPLMALFNFCQFGEIGEEKLSVAEIVQGMYYQGYDFQHFCAMTIPALLIEIIVRAAWYIRSVLNGNSFINIPFFTSRARNRKLNSMLCLSYASFCVINAGKVKLTKRPEAINYPTWVRFIELLVGEAKFWMIDRSIKKTSYIHEKLMKEYEESKRKFGLFDNEI